mmetsp:Transcript_12730/g.30353  ORF Transcript_12730/g.30353 Transcript_12730/m.30353 type:complete len:244 (+) Transcript_12730:713-1444(+)
MAAEHCTPANHDLRCFTFYNSGLKNFPIAIPCVCAPILCTPILCAPVLYAGQACLVCARLARACLARARILFLIFVVLVLRTTILRAAAEEVTNHRRHQQPRKACDDPHDQRRWRRNCVLFHNHHPLRHRDVLLDRHFCFLHRGIPEHHGRWRDVVRCKERVDPVWVRQHLEQVGDRHAGQERRDCQRRGAAPDAGRGNRHLVQPGSQHCHHALLERLDLLAKGFPAPVRPAEDEIHAYAPAL